METGDGATAAGTSTPLSGGDVPETSTSAEAKKVLCFGHHLDDDEDEEVDDLSGDTRAWTSSSLRAERRRSGLRCTRRR